MQTQEAVKPRRVFAWYETWPGQHNALLVDDKGRWYLGDVARNDGDVQGVSREVTVAEALRWYVATTIYANEGYGGDLSALCEAAAELLAPDPKPAPDVPAEQRTLSQNWGEANYLLYRINGHIRALDLLAREQCLKEKDGVDAASEMAHSLALLSTEIREVIDAMELPCRRGE